MAQASKDVFYTELIFLTIVSERRA
jgi:hypothetical protein